MIDAIKTYFREIPKDLLGAGIVLALTGGALWGLAIHAWQAHRYLDAAYLVFVGTLGLGYGLACFAGDSE